MKPTSVSMSELNLRLKPLTVKTGVITTHLILNWKAKLNNVWEALGYYSDEHHRKAQ